MKKANSRETSQPPEPNRGLRIALLAALLLAIALAASPFWGEACLESSPATRASNLSRSESAPGGIHYFSSGQWLADLRTFVAACQYLFDSDPAQPGYLAPPTVFQSVAAAAVSRPLSFS